MAKATVFVCESQPVVLEGLTRVFEANDDFVLCGSATTLPLALRALSQQRPGILLLEHPSNLRGSFPALAEVRDASPQTKTVLWVTDLAEHDAYRALQLGARGILNKSLPVNALLECFGAIVDDKLWFDKTVSSELAGFISRKSAARLTKRERQIAQLVCDGLRNKEIAEALTITPGTVKVHLMHIFEKTGIQGRQELTEHGRKLLEDVPEQLSATGGVGK